MTQSHHRRSPSSTHYPSKPKSSRPVLHRRGTSGANLSISKLGSGLPHSHSHSHSHSHHSSSSSHSRKDDESEFDMASFLNFCAMCERQITVPNNTLLYCSESCRRKDSCKPLSASMPSMSSMPSTISSTATTPPSSPPLSPRTIVAPMTPTRLQSLPSRIPNNTNHTSSSDLDPTEWKPVLSTTVPSTPTQILSSASTSGSASGSVSKSTDAWSYLSQFHGSSAPAPLLSRRSTSRSTTSLTGLTNGSGHVSGHGHTHTRNHSATPSLSSSISSSASDYLSSYETRPLPPRHNPSFSGSSTSKGVQLVVPHISSVPGVTLELVDESDSGSIFPASSSVWGNESSKPRAISIART